MSLAMCSCYLCVLAFYVAWCCLALLCCLLGLVGNGLASFWRLAHRASWRSCLLRVGAGIKSLRNNTCWLLLRIGIGFASEWHFLSWPLCLPSLVSSWLDSSWRVACRAFWRSSLPRASAWMRSLCFNACVLLLQVGVGIALGVRRARWSRPVAVAALACAATDWQGQTGRLGLVTCVAIALGRHLPLTLCRVLSSAVMFGLCQHVGPCSIILSAWAFLRPSFPEGASANAPSSPPQARGGSRRQRESPGSGRQWRPRHRPSPSAAVDVEIDLAAIDLDARLQLGSPSQNMETDAGVPLLEQRRAAYLQAARSSGSAAPPGDGSQAASSGTGQSW